MKSVITILGLGLLAMGCGSDDSSENSDPNAMGEGAEEQEEQEQEQQGVASLAELPPVQKLIAGLGGQALSELQGLRVASSGQRYLPHEGFRPEDDPLLAHEFQRSVSFDLENGFVRVDVEREIQFLLPGEQSYADIIRGNVGVSTQPFFGNPLGDLSSDRVAAIQVQEMLLNPHVLLRRFGSDNISEDGEAELGGVAHHRLVVESARPILLFVDTVTGQLSRLETMEHDFYRRDVAVVVDYTGWQSTDAGISYPTSVTLSRNGEVLFESEVSGFEANPEFDPATFEFPPASAPQFDPALFERGALSHQWYFLLDSIGLPFSGIDTLVTAAEIAPGVHQLQGASHHSFLVEQAEGLVLVDAPLYEDRSGALIDFVDGEFPGKPIAFVVASHFHEDHVAGIREVLGSTEATLVVHEGSADFWRELLAAPSTISPDALERSPREVEILTVPDDESLTLEDAEHPVELYDMNSQHADDLLLTRDATSNTVFVVDIYSPGNGDPFEPETVNTTLVDNDIPAEDLKIVGGHGTEVHDYATLQEFLTE